MGNKRISVSISIRNMCDDHIVMTGLVSKRYAFKDVLGILMQQWKRKSVHHDTIIKDRKINVQKYLTGTNALRKEYKCSFADAERLIFEQACSERLRKRGV